MHGEGMDIRGRPALVTGGGRGLGAALGETLATAGRAVVLVARGMLGSSTEVAARIRVGRAGEAHALAFDVGDKDAAHRITGAAAELVGPIDILVHAASTLGPLPMPFLLDTACEDLADVLETNLVGPFRLDKIVAGSMALRKTGVIVHVSSDAAVSGYPTWGAYGVSKAAFDQLARVLGAELAEHGVKVFSADPGEMDTRMHADAMPELDAAARAALAKPARHRGQDRRDDRPRRTYRARRAPHRAFVERAMNALAFPPATRARPLRETRLLVIRVASRTVREAPIAELPALLSPGDALVVNDAATLPASLFGRTRKNEPLELRLLALPGASRQCEVVVFGRGDWRTPTEHRAAPPSLSPGDILVFDSLAARVVSVRDTRRAVVVFERDRDDVVAALYRAGKRRAVRTHAQRAPLVGRAERLRRGALGRGDAVRGPSARLRRAERFAQARHRGREAHARRGSLVDRRREPRRVASVGRALPHPRGDGRHRLEKPSRHCRRHVRRCVRSSHRRATTVA